MLGSFCVDPRCWRQISFWLCVYIYKAQPNLIWLLACGENKTQVVDLSSFAGGFSMTNFILLGSFCVDPRLLASTPSGFVFTYIKLSRRLIWLKKGGCDGKYGVTTVTYYVVGDTKNAQKRLNEKSSIFAKQSSETDESAQLKGNDTILLKNPLQCTYVLKCISKAHSMK